MMSENPLITIGIPTYNRAMWLKQSIASCLQQTYSNIEVVVCDNASTDDTPLLVKRLNDTRIVYIRHNEPVPPFVNWNSCWQNAQGQYMTYLSDDDLLEPTFLSTLMEKVIRHPEAALYRSGLRCIDDQGSVKWEFTKYPYFETPEAFMVERIRNRRHQFLPGFLFRTLDIREVGGFSDIHLPAMLYLDEYLWMQLAFRGTAIISVNKALWNYRQHNMQYGGELLNLATFIKGVPHYIGLLSALARNSQCSQKTISFIETQYGSEMISSRIFHEMKRESAMSEISNTPKKQWLGEVDGNMLVVVGNGPSLRNFDLNSLNNVPTIGMNAAYRYWHKIGWYPTYYICLDTVVIESHKANIFELVQNSAQNSIRFFLLGRNIIESYPELRANPKVIIFEDYLLSPYFHKISHLTTGSHAALFAAFLGYKKLVLLGIDAIYAQQAPWAPSAEKICSNILKLSKTPKQNPNYFFDDYQQKGDLFRVPNLDLHYNSWVAVKKRLDELGVYVVNANRKSRVDMFDFSKNS